MCATIVWGINSGAFTDDFTEWTHALLATTPERSEYRIKSSRVRRSTVTFTLTRNGCDCRALVGAKASNVGPDEIGADALLQWIRDFPQIATHTTRLSMLRAWSPASLELVPARARGIVVGAVDEQILRDLGDNALLTIDY